MAIEDNMNLSTGIIEMHSTLSKLLEYNPYAEGTHSIQNNMIHNFVNVDLLRATTTRDFICMYPLTQQTCILYCDSSSATPVLEHTFVNVSNEYLI